MRNKFLFIVALPFLLLACAKSTDPSQCPYSASTAVASAAEIANIKAYLGADTLTYTKHASGIFYKISVAGAGITPVVCSDVTVKYTGRLTNGTVFDSSTPNYPSGITFTLGQLIIGWQMGIPLIQKGGSIKLVIPPSLGYGSNASGPIPANSILIFDIDLVNAL